MNHSASISDHPGAIRPGDGVVRAWLGLGLGEMRYLFVATKQTGGFARETRTPRQH